MAQPPEPPEPPDARERETALARLLADTLPWSLAEALGDGGEACGDGEHAWWQGYAEDCELAPGATAPAPLARDAWRALAREVLARGLATAVGGEPRVGDWDAVRVLAIGSLRRAP